jgi:DNA-binding Lrp family transcriptional regulator
MYKIIIDNTYRYVSRETLLVMREARMGQLDDEQLIGKIPEGGISRTLLASALDISVKSLNYLIRKEERKWNIIKVGDEIFQMDQYLPQEKRTDDQLVAKLLRSYPYLSVSQIEFCSGLKGNRLATTIQRMTQNGQIVRGITREEVPDELFVLADFQPKDLDAQVFVLEKRDAFVEILKQERDIDAQDGDYWLFVEDIPQAEFNLVKKGKNYQIQELKRFSQTTYPLASLLETLQVWGKSHSMTIMTDRVQDQYTQNYILLAQSFLERGYTISNDVLSIAKDKPPPTQTQTIETPKYSIQNWGTWQRNRQFINYDGSASDILFHVGQLDDIRSLAYRLNTRAEDLDLSDVIYLTGIDYRLGYLHKDHVEDVIRGWPRSGSITQIDKNILGELDEPRTTEELTVLTGMKPKQLRQRLRYLEKLRIIRKQVDQPKDLNSCQWIRFETGLEKIRKPISGKREFKGISVFIIKLLETNIPLTIQQISRYLGIPAKELSGYLETMVNRGTLREGYFISHQGERQFTVPEVLNSLENYEIDDEDKAAIDQVDLLPSSDPMTQTRLYDLVIQHYSLQPQERYPENAEQWMILFNGHPVGYLTKMPSATPLVDYEVDILVVETENLMTILAGTIQKVANIFRYWNNDEGRIRKINGLSPKEDKWRSIQFLIESIGIDL